MRQPWQMTIRGWLDAGRPMCGIRWEAVRVAQRPTFRKGFKWERQAVLDYLSLFPDGWGEGYIEPDPQEYQCHRDKKFAGRRWVLQIPSSLKSAFPCMIWYEDAREAILLGRILGYPEACIAFYVARNYKLVAR